MKVVAIVGSRTSSKDVYLNVTSKVEQILKNINKSKDIVVSGGANSGADKAAKYLCKKYGYRYVEAPAFWYQTSNYNTEFFRKNAGILRNKTIVDICTEMYAIWDGESHGTRHSIETAKQAGKPVTVIPL